MKEIHILFVATSHSTLGDTGKKTGLWLEELATPYYIFKDAGASVIFASPLGGRIPVDPKSQSIIVATTNTKRFLKDEEAMNLLANSVELGQHNAEDIDAVYLPGGHGPMWDLAENTQLRSLLESVHFQNKPIGAVCHGVAGLLSLKNDVGEYLIKGKKITGYSNAEEESAGLTKVVPFLLETAIVEHGAKYSKGPSYVSHTVEDGNIITGQNAASSEEVAKKMQAYIRDQKFKIRFENQIVMN